jgi:transcriptional regulator with XRE-family HTH domain
MATLKVPHQVGDLGGYLKEQRESARLSLRQLASAAGVSNPYLSQIERGLRKPSAEVLQQIAKGLQISAEALFLRAGLLEDSGGLEVEVAVQSDVQLTARQKRVLLDIYATFRAENARLTDQSADRSVDRSEMPGRANVVPPIATEPLKSESAQVDGAGDEVSVGTTRRGARKRAAAKTAKATAKTTRTGRTRAAKGTPAANRPTPTSTTTSTT